MAAFNTTFQICAQTRPCWVDGRRAIFHRWTDSARPVKPYGMEDDDTADRFQVWNVHGLVEYEDGTMARVWPNTIQFADSEQLFTEYDWGLPVTVRDGEAWICGADLTEPETETDTPTRCCETCAHVLREVWKEPCKGCRSFNRWEPAGGPAHGDSED